MVTDHLHQIKVMHIPQAQDILRTANLPHLVTTRLPLRDIHHPHQHLGVHRRVIHMDNMVLQEVIILHHHLSIIKVMVHLLQVMVSTGLRLLRAIKYLLIQALDRLVVYRQVLGNTQAMIKAGDIHHIHKEDLYRPVQELLVLLLYPSNYQKDP